MYSLESAEQNKSEYIKAEYERLEKRPTLMLIIRQNLANFLVKESQIQSYAENP